MARLLKTQKQRTRSIVLYLRLEELADAVDDELAHLGGEAGVDADEERLVHDDVGAGQFAVDAARDVLEAGLLEDVAGEDEPRLDLGFLEEGDEFAAADVGLERDGEAEPDGSAFGWTVGRMRCSSHCLRSSK